MNGKTFCQWVGLPDAKVTSFLFSFNSLSNMISMWMLGSQISPVQLTGTTTVMDAVIERLSPAKLKKGLTLECRHTNPFHWFSLPSTWTHPIEVRASVKECSVEDHFLPCSPFFLKDYLETFANSISEGYIVSGTRTMNSLFQYHFALCCQAFKQK